MRGRIVELKLEDEEIIAKIEIIEPEEPYVSVRADKSEDYRTENYEKELKEIRDLKLLDIVEIKKTEVTK